MGSQGTREIRQRDSLDRVLGVAASVEIAAAGRRRQHVGREGAREVRPLPSQCRTTLAKQEPSGSGWYWLHWGLAWWLAQSASLLLLLLLLSFLLLPSGPFLPQCLTASLLLHLLLLLLLLFFLSSCCCCCCCCGLVLNILCCCWVLWTSRCCDWDLTLIDVFGLQLDLCNTVVVDRLPLLLLSWIWLGFGQLIRLS